MLHFALPVTPANKKTFPPTHVIHLNDWKLKMRTCGFVCAEKINSWSHCRGLSVCLCSIYPVILLYTAGSKKKKTEVSLSSRFFIRHLFHVSPTDNTFFWTWNSRRKIEDLVQWNNLYLPHSSLWLPPVKIQRNSRFFRTFPLGGRSHKQQFKQSIKKKKKEKYFLHLHLTFFCVDTKHSLVSILIYCDT